MTPLFRKLNLGAIQVAHVLNAPASFAAELSALDGVAIRRSIRAREAFQFALAFAQTRAELDALCSKLVVAAPEDPVLWIAYPKKSSQRLQCEFDRDTGWQVLGDAGFEPVRQVAIDADWSALRFRRARLIGSFTRDRSRAISRTGSARAAKRST